LDHQRQDRRDTRADDEADAHLRHDLGATVEESREEEGYSSERRLERQRQQERGHDAGAEPLIAIAGPTPLGVRGEVDQDERDDEVDGDDHDQHRRDSFKHSGEHTHDFHPFVEMARPTTRRVPRR